MPTPPLRTRYRALILVLPLNSRLVRTSQVFVNHPGRLRPSVLEIINPPSGQIMGTKAPNDGAKEEEVPDKSRILPTTGKIPNVLHWVSLWLIKHVNAPQRWK